MKALLLTSLLGLPALASAQDDPDLQGMPALPDLDAPADLPPPPPRSSASLRGQWSTRALSDLKEDREGEDVFELRDRLSMELSAELSPSLSAVAGARFTHEVRSPQRDLGQARALGEAELREAHLTWREDRWQITVGHQTIRWGSAEANSPNDVIAPLDLRQGVQPGLQTPALPQIAARGLYTLGAEGQITLEAVLLPVFTPHKAALYGRDTAPLPAGTPFTGLLAGLRASTPRSSEEDLQPLLVAFNPPDEHIGNASGGGRATIRGQGWDLHLNGAYLWDRTPAITLAPSPVVPIDSRYHRQVTVGADGVIAVGEITFKGDVAWSPNRTLYTTALEPARSPAVSWATGLDWIPDPDHTLTLECFGFAPLDEAPSGERWQLIGRHLVNAVLFTRHQWGDLAFSLVLQRGLTLDDTFAAPEVQYTPAEGHQLALGVALFDGPPGSLGGTLTANDQGTLRYVYDF